MIAEQIADLNAGRLPFGVFLVPTGSFAGLFGFGGRLHLVFTPEALHWVALSGSTLKNDLAFKKSAGTLAWPDVEGFTHVHRQARRTHWWECAVTGKGAAMRWTDPCDPADSASETRRYAQIDLALFFYREAGPEALRAWWADAMDGATGDRDPVDYLYLMEKHFRRNAPA